MCDLKRGSRNPVLNNTEHINESNYSWKMSIKMLIKPKVNQKNDLHLWLNNYILAETAHIIVSEKPNYFYRTIGSVNFRKFFVVSSNRKSKECQDINLQRN